MTAITTVTRHELDAKLGRDPVALDFYQASCPPCRALEPRLERIAAQYLGRVPVYRIDIDRDMLVAARFGVKSIPTIVILHGGREDERLDGLITDPRPPCGVRTCRGGPDPAAGKHLTFPQR